MKEPQRFQGLSRQNKLDDHIQSEPTHTEALHSDHRQNEPHALKVEYSARERIDKHIKGPSNDRIPKKNNGSLSRMKQEGSSAKGFADSTKKGSQQTQRPARSGAGSLLEPGTPALPARKGRPQDSRTSTDTSDASSPTETSSTEMEALSAASAAFAAQKQFQRHSKTPPVDTQTAKSKGKADPRACAETSSAEMNALSSAAAAFEAQKHSMRQNRTPSGKAQVGNLRGSAAMPSSKLQADYPADVQTPSQAKASAEMDALSSAAAAFEAQKHSMRQSKSAKAQPRTNTLAPKGNAQADDLVKMVVGAALTKQQPEILKGVSAQNLQNHIMDSFFAGPGFQLPPTPEALPLPSSSLLQRSRRQ